MKYPQLKEKLLAMFDQEKRARRPVYWRNLCSLRPGRPLRGLLLLLPEVQGIQSHKKFVCRQSLSRVIHSGNYTKKMCTCTMKIE